MAARVLVVDDSPLITSVASDILSAAGFETRAVNDGAEGLAVAQQWRPDLLLLDLVMPGLDGWGVLTALRSDPATSGLRVIVVTSSAEAAQERRDELRTLGAGLLLKPIEAGRLLGAVRRSLGSNGSSGSAL